MAYTTTNVPTSYGASPFRKAAAYLQARSNYRRDRNDYRKLMQMSNRDLADMGVTRDSVREALRKPFSWQGAG
jgi:uncharacterized protein YjiS (DUF1127 family)